MALFQDLTAVIVYSADGKQQRMSFREQGENADLAAAFVINDRGQEEFLQLTLEPKKKLVLQELYLERAYGFQKTDRIFVNGYQSWTDSRERNIHDHLKKMNRLTAPVIRKYRIQQYGDYTFYKEPGRPGEFHGYTYAYVRNGSQLALIGSLTERQGFTVLAYSTQGGYLRISKDCEGLELDSSYPAFQLYAATGTQQEVFDGYFAAMKIGKPKGKPATGWTSWYNYYQNISEKIILENLGNFRKSEEKIDIFQIDDGYQTAVGDWLSVDKTKFPHGMGTIAAQIREAGCLPGLWLAPFVCETDSALYRQHPDWIVKDAQGEPVSCGCNWSGFYALDFYREEVRDYIRHVFRVVLDDWGYGLVKLDFLYAVCILPRPDKTRGQIMTEAMEFLRECVGDRLILGCGVPLGPAFGKVDYCRIGPDVSLLWDDKFYMHILLRERISTLHAIENAIGRRQLDGRAFFNDPDVFLLREDNIQLNDRQKQTLAMINRLFGSLLFTSDNLSLYGQKQWDLFHKTMQPADVRIEEAVYLTEKLLRITWQENGRRQQMLLNLGRRETHGVPAYGCLVTEAD